MQPFPPTGGQGMFYLVWQSFHTHHPSDDHHRGGRRGGSGTVPYVVLLYLNYKHSRLGWLSYQAYMVIYGVVIWMILHWGIISKVPSQSPEVCFGSTKYCFGILLHCSFNGALLLASLPDHHGHHCLLPRTPTSCIKVCWAGGRGPVLRMLGRFSRNRETPEKVTGLLQYIAKYQERELGFSVLQGWKRWP